MAGRAIIVSFAGRAILQAKEVDQGYDGVAFWIRPW